eukprot:643114-Rhodomonas_salina.4
MRGDGGFNREISMLVPALPCGDRLRVACGHFRTRVRATCAITPTVTVTVRGAAMVGQAELSGYDRSAVQREIDSLPS